MRAFISVLFGLLLVAAVGCTESNRTADFKAAKEIGKSFSVVSPAGGRTLSSPVISTSSDSTMLPPAPAKRSDQPNLQVIANSASLRIFKSALEKEFLWQPQIIRLINAPGFTGLKSRVVVFRQRGQKLFMLEASEGHSTNPENQQNFILADFPVTAETDEYLEFDFNAGMSDVYTLSDWRFNEANDRAYAGYPEFTSARVERSYLESAELTADNRLFIVQHLQLGADMGAEIAHAPIESRHYFEPYNPSADFKPFPGVTFERMGFFHIAPLLGKSGATQIYASHFHQATEKIITFAVSANTPPEYREAVMSGVLYWNKAFGYEKIRVVDAPAGVTAPNPNYNIIQWVDWDATGGAYADAQMDPRTGEILHAQVFMTSVFGFAGKNRALSHLRMVGGASKRPDQPKALSIAGLPSTRLCDYDETSIVANALNDLIAMNANDERALEVARDYIRYVVAHEVGHTLGLRHNFAGNMSANFDVTELDGLFTTYVKTGEVRAGLQPTSSVMEYASFPSSTLAGKVMGKAAEQAFTYDQKAIGVLYNGLALNPTEVPLFCTDSQHAKFIGCVQRDDGASPLADALYNEKKYSDSLPQNIVEKFIFAKTPPFGALAQSVDELRLNPALDATTYFSRRAIIMALLTDQAQDLRVYRSVGKVDDTNKDEILEKIFVSTATEVTRLGGLKTLLALPSPSLAANWIESFNTIIESPLYRSGVGYNGEPYTFTDAEVVTAKSMAAAYFTKLQEHLAVADLAALGKHAGALTDTPLTDEYAEILQHRMLEYLTSESSVFVERVTLGDNKVAHLTLPVYKYRHAVRIAAANLLTGRLAKVPDWGYAQHYNVRGQIVAKMKSLLMDTDIMRVKPDKNSRRVARWLMENKEILMTLDKRDPTNK